MKNFRKSGRHYYWLFSIVSDVIDISITQRKKIKEHTLTHRNKMNIITYGWSGHISGKLYLENGHKLLESIE